MAWHVAALGRMQRLPGLDTLTGEKREAPRQSSEQMAGILRQFADASKANKRIRENG